MTLNSGFNQQKSQQPSADTKSSKSGNNDNKLTLHRVVL